MVLKSLGLKLADIRDFLGSNASAVVLRDILEEQGRRLAKELEERTEACRRIASMIDSLNRTGDLPAETIPDMEDAMQKVSMRESEHFPRPRPGPCLRCRARTRRPQALRQLVEHRTWSS